MLHDTDDEVARTAWRVAVVLVAEEEQGEVVGEMVMELRPGGRDVQLSLSRALVDLGDVTEPALATAAASPDPAVAAHARATELLRQNPETGYSQTPAPGDARRRRTRSGAPTRRSGGTPPWRWAGLA
ncbi:hypothetical protein ACNFR7_11955 [Streptomyces sp. RM1]